MSICADVAPKPLRRDPSEDGPVMTDIDKMSDEELDAYLATRNEAKRSAPGALEYGWLLVVAGLVGAVASLQLLVSQWELEADPYANISCDFNEILACSTFLTSWEGSLLGFSNSYLGLAGFGGMILLGIYVLIKRSLPTVMWVAMSAAAVLSFLFLLWFQYTSFNAGTLCPWCLVIWAALIPFITHTAGQAHANLTGSHSWVWRYRWPITIVWYLAVAVFAFFYFYDTWMFMLGWE